jgi:hypothetical protein
MIIHNNFFSQHQHEQFTRRERGKGRGNRSHVATPCVGLTKTTIMLIKGAASQSQHH